MNNSSSLSSSSQAIEPDKTNTGMNQQTRKLSTSPLDPFARCICLLLITEIWYKYKNGYSGDSMLFYRFCLFASYFLCLIPIFLNVKSSKFAASDDFRFLLSYMYMIDPLWVVMLGMGVYSNSSVLFLLALLGLTKLSFFHFAERMLTGNIVIGLMSEIEDLTKIFVYNFGSYLVIDCCELSSLSLITLWRATLFSGHTLVAMKKLTFITEDAHVNIQRYLNHIRNAFTLLVLIFGFLSTNVRKGLAISAVGHLAYTSIRFSTLLQMGSNYLSDEEKDGWCVLSFSKKINILFVTGKYFWFSVELVLLLVCTLYFLVLRLIYLLQP